MPKSERSSAPRSSGRGPAAFSIQYWALFDHRNGEFVGCGGLLPWLYTPGEANFEVGVHLVKRCWGKGFAIEAAFGALGGGAGALHLMASPGPAGWSRSLLSGRRFARRRGWILPAR